MSARESMENELARLEAQHSRYLLAAHTSADRRIVIRRLVAVERLAEEIDALRQALSALDEHTAPLFVADDYTIPFSVGQRSGLLAAP